MTTRFWDRCFAFDQFGPLSIRPCHGTCWATKRHPDRLRATYKRTHGIRYFHGCYSLSEDRLWGVLHKHKGGTYTLAALKSIRKARPDGAPIYIILDNLSTNTTPAIRTWCQRNKVELCLTPQERLLGETDRGTVRAVTAVHPRQLRPPQPPSTRPGNAHLPALAQRQQPASRRPRRTTPRTRPNPAANATNAGDAHNPE